MRVILRLKHGPIIRRKRRKNQQVALAASALLTPAAVMACALALWRIGADLALTGPFAIPSGVFSHWQVWFALAALLEVCALSLSRYGAMQDTVRSEESESAHMPR